MLTTLYQSYRGNLKLLSFKFNWKLEIKGFLLNLWYNWGLGIEGCEQDCIIYNKVGTVGILDQIIHISLLCCPLCCSLAASLASLTSGSSFRFQLQQLKMSRCMLNRFSCLPLCATPMDCSPPGSSLHGILQARILHALLQGIFPTQHWQMFLGGRGWDKVLSANWE